jgi:hypothetical protein
MLTEWTKYQIRANGRPVINTLVEAVYSSKMLRQAIFRICCFRKKNSCKSLNNKISFLYNGCITLLSAI